MTEAEKPYEMLKNVQEPKGYYFNKDKERVFELLEALLINKKRYEILSWGIFS
jgi:ferredoxin-thioredoxin reductase catalytic subunit